MRQVGILAAAGLYALDEVVPKLGEDHYKTYKIAEGKYLSLQLVSFFGNKHLLAYSQHAARMMFFIQHSMLLHCATNNENEVR